MSNGRNVRINRGYDIKLIGAAAAQCVDLPVSDLVAVKPSDFRGVVPKLLVKVGDEVQAGQPVFFDKNREELKFPAPVSGEIVDIVRGEKRRILEVRILPDKSNVKYVDYGKSDPSKMDRGAIIERLLESGAWNYLRQRPYGVIANPQDEPKAIYVSCFDSSPLAPDMDYVLSNEADNFRAGLEVLRVLSGNKLNLGVRPGQTVPGASEMSGVTVHTFNGPHPAGNVGIQIHHTDPVGAGETVWTAAPQDVVIIGRLFTEGHYNPTRVVAAAGSCLSEPKYYRMICGQQLSTFLNDQIKDDNCRIIQGNILTGAKSSKEDFLSFYCNQVTVIPEGNHYEFLGWLMPGLNKLSLSRTFFSWLNKNKKYNLDTNLHGEERNFVMTNQYEQVLPMNIYPVFLLKSIMARDVERMEQLGIYEVIEEDLALCEFVCTSKIDVQQIITEGLEYMRTEA
jgi:Na+-transporting NADH:ubiquinone oxidoreductase subunit A